MPIDPITGIVEAFKTHDVVALSEGNHGNEQGHAFRLALIRDPRFSAAVNDIVVEFGNAHYQAVGSLTDAAPILRVGVLAQDCYS